MADSLEGRVSLITGAASGIGRATALAFAREGAKVAVADIDPEGGEQTVHLIEDTGGEALFVSVDVTKASEVQAMVDAVVDAYGRLDCAFNNAGVGGIGVPTHEHTTEDWDRTLGINLKGVWLCMKYEIPRMLEHGRGAIVNTASMLGVIGMAGMSAYVASKHGVVGLTKSAALEYAKQGIRVNALCPGVIRTPMNEKYWKEFPETEEPLREAEPIGRFGEPEEMAEVALWLCSDAASFVTGHAMLADGGYVAQ